MPIDTALLNRIKSNDPALNILDLSYQRLNDSDMQELAKALANNTNLTTLDVNSNQIGAEGAKALATNIALTTLFIGDNQIGTEGAQALAANSTLMVLDVGLNQIGIEGVKALATNTTLTTLHIESNQIGDEGAKALAANSTLTTLNVGHNQIRTEGAQALAMSTNLTTLFIGDNQIGTKGAQALAVNSTLMVLDVGWNQIGDEGAKALAMNTTLTTLTVGYNQIGDEDDKQLKQAIARNNQQMVSRRNQFIQKLLLLANDKANSASRSLWSSLPKELMLHIISLIDFRSTESIGKSAQQIKACAEFIFNHAPQMKAALAESVKTKQGLKIMEKIIQGKSQFQFFPHPPQIASHENILKQQEDNEKSNKNPNIFEDPKS